ncbi:hypothetical protein [Staphylococcus nepalensis]|uniref:hypothetical protein n=1 Tax=Staphylococcus nepalensis TaxID=214473 RepID=UPI001A99E63E|nr:hypothetical protein [Staphylococcus nepalensis]MBO1222560.1 hypothetical protein [Staphylococcus nepalensis]
MAKTVQDNTINIFDNAIYNKGVRSKKLKQEYSELTERIKTVGNKIEFHKKNDDFAEAVKLKRQQADLESELVELDDKLNEENFKVTEEEFEKFYNSYHEEMAELKGNHQKLTNKLNKKLEEVADIYSEIIEVKNEAGRRISRERYVKQEKIAPNATYNHYKGQMLANEVDLSNGKQENTPRSISWQLEHKLRDVSLKEFQQYHYGNKQW